MSWTTTWDGESGPLHKIPGNSPDNNWTWFGSSHPFTGAVWKDKPRPSCYALLGGYLIDNVHGWHSLLGLFETLADVQYYSQTCRLPGKWFQIVDLSGGAIIESWPEPKV